MVMVFLLLSHMRGNLNALKILGLQTFHPKPPRFFSNSGICYYRKVKVSLDRQHFFFLLGECRTYFYSNSNILAGYIQVWFSVLQFCLTCSESFCSRYLGLCMTQRSCFLLNICLCLLLHFW